MSQGNFTLTKYELDDGTTIVPVNLQPETLGFSSGGQANDAPAGAVNLNLRAKARKGNAEYGIGCRSISISWDTGAAPAGYQESGTLTVPIMVKANFDGYTVGTACTYAGGTGTIVGKKAENLK